MTLTTILTIWISGISCALIFHTWMLMDCLFDYGAVTALIRHRVKGYGPAHVHVARSNIIRELVRINAHFQFLMVAVIVIARPDWLPRSAWVYCLMFAGGFFVLNSILDRRSRIRLKTIIIAAAQAERESGFERVELEC